MPSFVRVKGISTTVGAVVLTAASASGATATFTPIGPTTVDAGTDVVFEISVSVTTLTAFNSADVIIGSHDATNIDFTYSDAWLAAFSSVKPPVFDVGFYAQDVFVGGNNPTPIGTSLVLGTITITTTGMAGGSHVVQVDNAFDGFSTLGLDGQPEPLVGSATFAVLTGPCDVPAQPAPEPTVADNGFGTRNRFLSWRGGTPGQQQAARVTFDVGNGTQIMWVGDPVRICEQSGNPGSCEPGFWAARLVCEPFFTDWSQFDAVHVSGETIIPAQSYAIALVSFGCEADEAAYSAPLAINTSAYGDTVGAFLSPPGEWAAPQGAPDFDDISSTVDKFRNLATAPSKTRADVDPATPDFLVDFGDIPAVVDGFRLVPFPYTPPVNPCP